MALSLLAYGHEDELDTPRIAGAVRGTGHGWGSPGRTSPGSSSG